MRTSAFALLLVFMPALAPAQKKPVTIESLSAAPPSREGFGQVYWAPEGRRFAYTEGRAVLLYDVPAARKKELLKLPDLEAKAVKYDRPEAFAFENRGVSEQAMQWSSDGKAMLFSAGGDIFLLHMDTGAWEQLTATPVPERDPKFSPDGARVSFRRDHDLYVMGLASRQVTRLTTDGSATLFNGELDWVYPEELDLGTAYWWSPDSQRIAYMQFDVSREWIYPHADLLPNPARAEPQRFPQPGSPNADVRIGVVPASGGQTRWMDLGDTRDSLLARVAWSPDSSHIFVERLNRVQNRLDLMSADVASGGARLILREEDRYWVNVNDVFRFLQDGKRFLWGSERGGFLHLYLYSSEGKLIKQITRGDWEVTEVAGMDEEAGGVYYLSTETSPLERQLWRVGLDGRHKQRITAAAGTHAISMSPACAYFLDTNSSLKTPARRTVRTRDGAEAGVWREAPPQEYEILPTEIVEVKASDGTLLYARLIRPKDFQPGRKYPAIVGIYGGPHVQSVRNSWYGANWDQAMAQRGFVIWQLDNRGSAGRGHGFASKVFRNLGEAELKDQEEGVRHLLSMGFSDPARIGITGWSYGGFMTLFSLTNAPKLFRAGIAGAPVTDWRNYDSIYTERYMGLPADNNEGYARSSPVAKAADLAARLMLVHNVEDDNVHFQNTLQMTDALQRAGKRFEMMLYPQKAHGVTGPVRRHLNQAMADFFEENLK